MTAELLTPKDGIFAELVAKLDLHIGSTERLTRQLHALTRPPAQPIFARREGSVSLNASGVGSLRIDGPEQGRMWYVHRIIAGGVTRATTTAGIADVYVSPSDAITSASSLAELVDSTNLTTLPGVAFYSRGQVALQWPDNLFVVFTGGTNGQQVVATAFIEEIELATRPQVDTV